MGARVDIVSRNDAGAESLGDIVVRPVHLSATRIDGDEVPSLIDEKFKSMTTDSGNLIEPAWSLIGWRKILYLRPVTFGFIGIQVVTRIESLWM